MQRVDRIGRAFSAARDVSFALSCASHAEAGSKSSFLDNSHQFIAKLIADRNLLFADVDKTTLYLTQLPDIDDKRMMHPDKRRLQLGFDIL